MICKVCGEGIEARLVTCSRCETVHHEECFTYAGACSIFGCGSLAYRTAGAEKQIPKNLPVIRETVYLVVMPERQPPSTWGIVDPFRHGPRWVLDEFFHHYDQAKQNGRPDPAGDALFILCLGWTEEEARLRRIADERDALRAWYARRHAGSYFESFQQPVTEDGVSLGMQAGIMTGMFGAFFAVTLGAPAFTVGAAVGISTALYLCYKDATASYWEEKTNQHKQRLAFEEQRLINQYCRRLQIGR